MVSGLFDQLDNVLYDETKNPMYYIPKTDDSSDIDVESSLEIHENNYLTSSLQYDSIQSVPKLSDNFSNLSSSNFLCVNSPDDFNSYETNKTLSDDSISIHKNVTNIKPSEDMKDECENWTTHFPHFRLVLF